MSSKESGESNAVRLTAWDWVIVAVVLAVVVLALPRIWSITEGFTPDPAYRTPYALSEDYWHFNRYARRAARTGGIIVLGDSVVWGEYTSPEETLPQYLAARTGISWLNLGINGIHPVALDGLVRYHARPLRNRRVLLHFNPLWMSSPRHDLSTDREFRFNHPQLVPQFLPRIPCYHEADDRRAGIVAGRYVPLRGFAAHLAIAYYDNKTPPMWAVSNPYDSLALPLGAGLPEPESERNVDARPWTERGITPQPFAWTRPEDSLQWRFFQKTALRLRARGNEVFVLVGPFNAHMIAPESQDAYARILNAAHDWLAAEGFAHHVAAPLPGMLYADASHPVAEGYALLADTLLEQASFQRFLGLDASAASSADKHGPATKLRATRRR